MASQLPEYYRHLAEERSSKKSTPASQEKRPEPDVDVAPPAVDYRADTFSMKLYEEWQDKTVYILAGPSTDGVQHNITITGTSEIELDSLVDFADWQVKALEENLKGCRLLLKEPIELQNGLPAYRAIFVWYPTDDRRLYQEQVYVLHKERGFTITASFTKKTRKTLGPQIQRMMLSFSPGGDSASSKSAPSRAF